MCYEMRATYYEYAGDKYWPIVEFNGVSYADLCFLFPRRFLENTVGTEIFLLPTCATAPEAVAYAQRFVDRFEGIFGYIRRFGVGQMLALYVAYAGVEHG